MPRVVDVEGRREQAIAASAKLISEGGFPRLTLSNLAKELGGSMRLVTHYFRDRQELITALLESGLKDTENILESLAMMHDSRERLRTGLAWFLPDDPESLRLERVRVALILHKEEEPVIGNFFAEVEGAMRKVLAASLPQELPAEDRLMVTDMLRAWTTGIAVASVEHPEVWTPERQHVVLDYFLDHLPFGFLTK